MFLLWLVNIKYINLSLVISFPKHKISLQINIFNLLTFMTRTQILQHKDRYDIFTEYVHISEDVSQLSSKEYNFLKIFSYCVA